MSPKPTKDMEDTLQAILDKLVNLQHELHTTQENHLALQRDLESRQSVWESKHDILTLTSLFPTLYSQTTTHPSYMNPTSHFNQFSMDVTSFIPLPGTTTTQPTLLQQLQPFPPLLFLLYAHQKYNYLSLMALTLWTGYSKLTNFFNFTIFLGMLD